MLAGNIIAIELDGCIRDESTQTVMPGALDAIYHLINEHYRIVILIDDEANKKSIEDWLISCDKPMLTNIVAESVVVTSFGSPTAIISARALRYTDWKDMEKYFIGRNVEVPKQIKFWKVKSYDMGRSIDEIPDPV